jgi:hypothetical protein
LLHGASRPGSYYSVRGSGSCWASLGHSSFFAEARCKDENERPQTIERQQISKMVSPTRSPARPDARVQPVGLQFGNGSGEHLRFASAPRECLVMKRTTLPAFFPSHSGSWSSLMGQSRQHERRFWTAPATHPIFVRLANRLRSITWASKKAITRQPRRHSLNRAPGGASGGGAHRAEMPLRTEQVASFADVCCAKRSNFGLSSTKPGTW